jgi:hypothetical protein
MTRFDGSLARQLDFGGITTTTFSPSRLVTAELRRLRLVGVRSPAVPAGRGPDKYKELEHRRRQAQITARRLLDL